MEPTPGLTPALDFNHALLQSRDQARAQWADGLAQFQAQMAPIHDPSLPKVVQAAAPAFALGFSFSAQTLIHEEQKLLRVSLRHRGGAEEFSEALAPEEGSQAWHELTALLLSGLLGIPVADATQANEPDLQSVARLVNGTPVGEPAAAGPAAAEPAAESPGSAVAPLSPPSGDDEWSDPADVPPVVGGPGVAPEGAAGGLEPLTKAEIATLHQFLGAMPQEARKRFSIEFRHHFQVPREARTIKDRITQRRHKDFIDVFERELAGGTP
ncbi:MAG: hypothetical protein K0U63_11180 [Cyanobacteria bacterium]|nr:hypothetical protein [Cyanobacteriota bacterium]